MDERFGQIARPFYGALGARNLWLNYRASIKKHPVLSAEILCECLFIHVSTAVIRIYANWYLRIIKSQSLLFASQCDYDIYLQN